MYIIWTIIQAPIHAGGGTFWNIYAEILNILPVATTKIQHFYFPLRSPYNFFLIYNARYISLSISLLLSNI